MLRHLFYSLMLLFLTLSVFGCSSNNSEVPPLGSNPGTTEAHVVGWISLHGAEATADLRGCQGCHGFDFNGAGQAVSCFNCHSSGPPFVGAHPASWNADALLGHQQNFQGALSDQTPWTTCAVAACHGPNLAGGTSGPTCQNNTANCHTTGTNGWPPAPANHSTFNVAAAATDAVHGRAAKGETDPTQSMGNNCILCHGTQPNTFDGGFVSDSAIINNGSGNCSVCHPTATAHPTNWTSTRTGNSVFHNDGSLTDGIQSDSCALCHTTTGTSPASPFPGAPTCFASSYNGLNCHATGPGGAPHAMPYLDPALHGLAAKADSSSTTGLIYCQTCHAESGGAGTNPQFNIPKGSMVNGCEDCHVAGAHPTGSDRWTFDLDPAEVIRRTHFATRNSVSTACVLCHDVNGTSNGGTAPVCTTCHASTTTFNLDCAYCHELPPVNAGATSRTGAIFVDHSMFAGGDVTDILNHEDCSICHGASPDGATGFLIAKTADYKLLGDAGTEQGGSHVNACVEVNSDVGYQDRFTTIVADRFGCAAACHPNDTNHQMSDSGIGIIEGSFTTGTIACNDCHGYPPDGVTAAPGATVSSHVGGTLGADLLDRHGDCQTCHGTRRDSGSGTTHVPVNVNYDPATNHYNGQINMNSTTGYDAVTGGCNTAVCHGNDAAHRVPPTSSLTIEGGDYGSGDCSTCHGYPPDGTSAPLTAPGGTTAVDHIISLDATGDRLKAAHGECQTCHGTKDDGSGGFSSISPYVAATMHRDGQVQMNSDTGYNITTFGCDTAGCHGNIPMSSAAPGLTVDLIALGVSGACDTCHGGLPTDGSPIATNAHTKHISSLNSVSVTCNVCHGHTGSGTTHNDGNVDILFSDLAAGGGYTGATKQCSNIYCHGTSNTFDWDAGVAISCGDCHGDATGRPVAPNEPSGGSHLTPSHLSEACTTCHPHDGIDTTDHVNGSNFTPANTNGDAQIIESGAITVHLYGGTVASSPDPDGFRYSASNCTTTCHSSGVWGSAGGCNFCHGYPPDGTNGSTDHLSRSGVGSTDSDFFNAHDTCATCHGVAGNQVPPTLATARTGAINLLASGGDRYLDPAMHNDGLVQINGYSVATGDGTDDTNAGYNGTGGCAKACHAASYVITSLNTSNTLDPREFGSGTCTSCHNGTGSGATLVNNLSPHALNTTFLNCEQCHTGHNAGTIEIPNNPAVGINYSANGEAGIALGGTSAPGATEAEICWNCHNLFPGLSEWGVNNKANTGSMTYNYGTLSTSNWTTATWTSGTGAFSYKTGAIQSTHTANPSVTDANTSTNGQGGRTEVPNNVADIRCSYCHDVHDLNQASGDTLSGAPYLRGSWMGNPYKEDGAPQAGTNYTSNNTWGAVPRASAATNMQMGGYWIDQNSGNPTSTFTLGNSAGLCTLCHGTNVNGMDQKTGENLWVGTNGHSSAVIGGTGTVAANIFDARGGQSGNTNNPYQHYQGFADPADNGNFGFRSVNSNAFQYTPLLSSTNTRPRKFNSDEWGVNETGSTTESGYHSFSCSKCHNPHASRLPKLMITNCLDTKHNTWDDSYQLNGSNGSNNTNRSISNWTSAQNCHRRGGIASGSKEPVDPSAVSGVGSGWNVVTPW